MTKDCIILIDFYKSHSMPKLSIINKEENTTKELTIEHRGFMNHAITISHDNNEASELLNKVDWIKNKPIVSVNSKTGQIDYYKLTRKALDVITDKAIEQHVNYPK